MAVSYRNLVNLLLDTGLRLPEPVRRDQLLQLNIPAEAGEFWKDKRVVPPSACSLTLRSVEWRNHYGERRFTWKFDSITGE